MCIRDRTLLDAKREAMRAYCAQVRGRKFAEPVMFLVASTIDEATEYRDLLIGSDMLGSAEQVLLVTSEEPDATLALLDRCLLYTSDAADERSSVDLGGRRIIKKKTKRAHRDKGRQRQRKQEQESTHADRKDEGTKRLNKKTR